MNEDFSRYHPEIQKRARELRRPQTPAEQALWCVLRNSQLEGLKFRRQHPIGPFILDFYCAMLKLAVEVDGDSHADQVEYDTARTEWLNDRGIRVIRFTNDEVKKNLDGVVAEILKNCRTIP